MKRTLNIAHNSMEGHALYFQNFARRFPAWGKRTFPPIRGREWPLCFIEKWSQFRITTSILASVISETVMPKAPFYFRVNEALCLAACVAQINRHSGRAARVFL